MSRTDKDAPFWVVAARDPQAKEWHYGCPHSERGGYWITRKQTVEHPADWHTVTEYKFTDFEGLTWWGSAEKALDYQGHPRSNLVWRDEALVTRQTYIFGPRVETVTERVFLTRPCDLDHDSQDDSTRLRCRRYPSNRSRSWRWRSPSREDRRLYTHKPERSRVRSALKVAAAEYNGSGHSEADFAPVVPTPVVY